MLPLLAVSFAGLVAVAILAIVIGGFLLVKMPKINAAIAMEGRLTELESRVDRVASQLATFSARTPQPQLGVVVSPTAPAVRPETRAPFEPRVPAVTIAAPPQADDSPAGVDIVLAAKPSIEERLGTNWLSKAGASILVLGVAFFLAYQLGQLGPAGKDLIGYTAAAALLACGAFLERRSGYQLFSRSATGGGWALMFFTTYAVNHVPAARIVSSTTIDLVLMLSVAGGMVAHTLRYRSQAVTVLAFVLAFSTVAISHDTVFSLSAGVVLACAATVIANRMRWFALELGAIAATYLNHFVWLHPVVDSAGHQPFPQFWTSVAILVIYWAIFRTSYIFRAPDSPAREQWSTLAAILNSALLLMVARYQTASPELAFRGLVALGIVEVALAQLPQTRRRRNAFVTLTTIGMTALVAALPYRFGGARLSVLWLAEAEALVFVAVWTRDRLFHRLGVLTAAIVGAQMLAVASGAIISPIAAATASGRALGLTLLTAAGAFYLNAHFVPRRWADMFTHRFDKPLAVCFSCVASAFVLLAIWYELIPLSVALAWALLGLVLVEAGVRSHTIHLRVQGYAALALSFLRIFVVNLNVSGAGWLNPRLYSIAPLVALYLWLYRRLDLLDRGEIPEFRGLAGPAFSYVATIVLASLAWSELPADDVIVGWAALIVALLLTAVTLERRVFVGQAVLGAVAVGAHGVLHNLYGRSYFADNLLRSPEFSVGVSASLLLASLVFAFRLRDQTRRSAGHWLLTILDRRPEQVLFFTALTLITWLLAVRLPSGALTIGWGIEGVAVFLFALLVRERTFRLSALGLLVFCVLRIGAVDAWSLNARDRYLTFIGLGAALLAVSFLYSRYRALVREYL